VFDRAAPPRGRRGAVAHHAADGERSPHRHQAESFARRIVAALERDRRQDRFRQVVLIAGPALLGMLREAMKGPLNSMIIGQVTADLTHRPIAMAQAEVEAMLARGEL
jgi:protein required for attachment to host cells